MADIQLRFNKDMLVLSTPIDVQLRRMGMDFDRDNELALLLEPEILHEAYALEAAAGAQCLVANTVNLTPARLAHSRCAGTAKDLAEAALAVVNELAPQHVLAEIGSCGLPLDASSAASLNENRDQYARAAKAFDGLGSQFDAFFLNGFTSTADLKCALMGMRKVTDKPIFASVGLSCEGAGCDALEAAGADSSSFTLGGKGRETLQDAASVMAEYGAQVAGFSVAASIEQIEELVGQVKAACFLPMLVQICVEKVDPEQGKPTPGNPYFEPDTMVDAAERLQDCGVQFLRAVGNAIPSYAGALVAATLGEDVSLENRQPESTFMKEANLDDLAQSLKARIDAALGN